MSDIQARVPAKLVMDVNGHALSLARTSEAYRQAVSKADIIHADGGFIVSASKRRKGAQIPERSGTTDMIHDFAQRFVQTGNTFYLLGGTEEVNAQCCERLLSMYPGLKIVGRRNGYFSEEEERSIIDDINRSGADVLWVGLGKPKEQFFSVKWQSELKVSWVITCGGCYNYITGDYKRAPQWMQNANLEWLHRLATNPRKLFWRYFVTNPHALFITLFGKTS